MEFPEFARRPRGTEGSREMASVTLDHWESTRGRPGRVTLPPISPSPISKPNFLSVGAPGPRAQYDPHQPPVGHFFLAISAAPATNGRQAIAPRARGSTATAPGSNGRRYCAGGAAGFRILLATRTALKDQQKRAWFTCMDGIPGICSPPTRHRRIKGNGFRNP